MKESNETTLSGENAFKLYDTYGFPYELTTLEYARDNGFTVDEGRFQAEMQAQNRARAARNTETSMNDYNLQYYVISP